MQTAARWNGECPTPSSISDGGVFVQSQFVGGAAQMSAADEEAKRCQNAKRAVLLAPGKQENGSNTKTPFRSDPLRSPGMARRATCGQEKEPPLLVSTKSAWAFRAKKATYVEPACGIHDTVAGGEA